MKNRITGLLVLSVVLAFAGGCQYFGLKKGSDPKAVADQFWSATKTGDPKKIEPFVTKASLSSNMMKEKSEATAGEYTLGEVKIDGDNATVAVVLKDKGMNMEVQTILIKENGAWKVEVEKTMMTMFGGALGEMMKGLEKGLTEMGKGLGAGMEAAGKEIQKAVESAQSEKNVAEAKVFDAGEKVSVEWKGAWYESEILECSATQCKIHYTGWSDSWDEWVTFDRIRRTP